MQGTSRINSFEAFHMVTGLKVQILMTSRSPSETIQKYDMSCVKGWFDGSMHYTQSPLVIFYRQARMVHFMHHLCDNACGKRISDFMNRLSKYRGRGMKVVISHMVTARMHICLRKMRF